MNYLDAQQNTNVDPAAIVEQSRENLGREVPLFVENPPCGGVCLIVGGGPSLNSADLRVKYNRGGFLWALNGSHDWLIDHGFTPDVHVLLDARPSTVAFVQRPSASTIYLVASQVHPGVFDALKGHKVLQWCAAADGMKEVADQHPELPICLVGGGETVGLKAIFLAYLSGFRRIELFGMDSSYAGNEHHSYPQAQNDGETVEEITVCGKIFRVAPWMKRQAFQFIEQRAMLAKYGCSIKANGPGLLPWLAGHAVTDEVRDD